jgi:hypothetical protein
MTDWGSSGNSSRSGRKSGIEFFGGTPAGSIGSLLARVGCLAS